ncbi:MAG TPA: hypothetical protein VMB51_10275 [Solirubrobacteraceae bacterium]|nr:hypothetical protein [Solirubrobacteraceae bacterium]
MRKGACIIGVVVALGAGLLDASAAAAAAKVWFENQHLEHLAVGSQVESMFEFRTAEGAFCRVGNLTGAAQTNGAAKSKLSFSSPPPEANRCGTGAAAIRTAAISVSATSKDVLTLATGAKQPIVFENSYFCAYDFRTFTGSFTSPANLGFFDVTSTGTLDKAISLGEGCAVTLKQEFGWHLYTDDGNEDVSVAVEL